MDDSLSTIEAPTNNQTRTFGEGHALTTFLQWLVLIFSIIAAAVSGLSIWCLCLQKVWKPQSTPLLNLAVAELLSSVFGSLLPMLHETVPSVFSFGPWLEDTAMVASSLGYNSSVFFLISISMEQSLALLWEGLLKPLQTKHYSVLCAILWVLAFALTGMDYEFCTQDTDTDFTLEEMTQRYERWCQSLLCLLSTLALVEFIAFMVMCGVVILKKHGQKPCSKLCVAICMAGLCTFLALGIVFWVEDYAFDLFKETIPHILLLSCNGRYHDWKFKQHFKNLWQKLSCNHFLKQERDDRIVSTAMQLKRLLLTDPMENTEPRDVALS